MRVRALAVFGVVVLLVVLAHLGCAPVAGEAQYVEGDEWVVDQPPPVPYDEYVPPPPTTSHLWVPGYWSWDGRAYVWTRGYYAVPPRRGHVWVRSGWVLRGGRYHYVRGYWSAPKRRIPHRYVHPAPHVHRARAYRTGPRQAPPHVPRR